MENEFFEEIKARALAVNIPVRKLFTEAGIDTALVFHWGKKPPRAIELYLPIIKELQEWNIDIINMEGSVYERVFNACEQLGISSDILYADNGFSKNLVRRHREAGTTEAVEKYFNLIKTLRQYEKVETPPSTE